MNENNSIEFKEINVPENNIISKLEEEVTARIAAEERADRLEAKLYCLENGVKSEYVDDVTAIAGVLFAEEDMESAIKAVLEKYPFFCGVQAKNAPVTTGVHFPAAAKNTFSGVEAAFRKSNPNIRL